MAKVEKFDFGSIVIDGKSYGKDVLIFADGTVKERKGCFWKFGSHDIKKGEIEEIARDAPEAIIVGTGTNGRAHLAPGIEGWAKERNLNLIVQPSEEAIARLHELTGQRKKVAALIHITC